VALASVAGGLSIATKPTVGVALIVITIGVLVVAFRSRARSLAVVWLVGLVVSGSYWFVKNLVLVGNPLPGVKIAVDGLSLPLVTPRNQCCPVSHSLTNWSTWRDLFLPGLETALSSAWPLVIGLALLGGVLTMLLGRSFLERVVGVAVLASAVGYLFTPLTAAGIGGQSFVINLRYLTPALFLGCVLLPRVPLVSERGRWWACAVPFLVGLLFGYVAPHYEQTTAWPVQYAFGIVLVVAAAAALLVLLVPAPSPGREPRGRRAVLAPAAVVVAVVVVVAGYVVQDRFFEDRYRTVADAQGGYNLVFNHLHDQRVALFGTAVQYPLLGPDLSNVVRQVAQPEGAAIADARRDRAAACRAWRRALRRGRYGYVVLVTGTFLPGPNPEPWVTTDPASKIVARGHDYRVVRVAGALHPDECTLAARAQDAAAASSNVPST
jgi:hypothetical protein